MSLEDAAPIPSRETLRSRRKRAVRVGDIMNMTRERVRQIEILEQLLAKNAEERSKIETALAAIRAR
jgi:DNA-directed RNA polymerase sigma subunit (sigma70/sigma32)